MFVNSSYTCLINDTIIKCFDSTIMGDQNKLSVIKLSDDCVISKADLICTTTSLPKLFQV